MHELKIGFWKKESGNYTSHSKGLSAEDVQALQELQPGDRFIVWTNTKKLNEMSPDLSLKVFRTEGMK